MLKGSRVRFVPQSGSQSFGEMRRLDVRKQGANTPLGAIEHKGSEKKKSHCCQPFCGIDVCRLHTDLMKEKAALD